MRDPSQGRAAPPLPPASRSRARARPPSAAIVVSLVAALLLAAYFVVWTGASRDDAAGNDGTASVVAAQVWRDGLGSRVYDQDLEMSRHQAQDSAGVHFDLPFITPPTTVLLASPLAGLDLALAGRILGGAEGLLIGVAIAIALAAAPRSLTPPGRLAAGLAAAAGVGTLVTLLMGQWDGLCALGLAAGYACWRRDRLFLGGALLVLPFALTKPHLALGMAAALLGWGRFRVLGGAMLSTVGALVVGCVVAGPQGWTDWLGALSLSSTHSPLPSLLGLSGLAGSWLGDGTPARVVAGVLTVPALAACVVLGHRLRGHPEELGSVLAGTAALSLAVAPHLLTHDLAVLAPAMAWTLAEAAQRGQLRVVAGLWALLDVASTLDLGRSSTGPPGRVVPVALLMLGAAALTRGARRNAAHELLPGGPRRRPTRSAYSGSGRGVGGVVDQS